jgi:hypothetical protein
MLSSNLVTSQVLDPSLGPILMVSTERMAYLWVNLHITNGHHADGLPNTETNTRSNTTVEARETVLRVDVTEGVADSHLLGTVGVLLLALHLNTDDLDGLVPGTETTTKTTGHDLLPGTELLTVLLAGKRADPTLGETTETESATPVGHLADGDGVDTLVDTSDTLLAVDIHEGLEGRGGLDTGGSHLVLGNLDRLHAGAETHGGVGLSDTTDDTTSDTTEEFVGAGAAGVELGLGGDEEQDGTLGGSFNPGPGNEALVDCDEEWLDHVGVDGGRVGSRCCHHGWQPWWS